MFAALTSSQPLRLSSITNTQGGQREAQCTRTRFQQFRITEHYQIYGVSGLCQRDADIRANACGLAGGQRDVWQRGRRVRQSRPCLALQVVLDVGRVFDLAHPLLDDLL